MRSTASKRARDKCIGSSDASTCQRAFLTVLASQRVRAVHIEMDAIKMPEIVRTLPIIRSIAPRTLGDLLIMPARNAMPQTVSTMAMKKMHTTTERQQ